MPHRLGSFRAEDPGPNVCPVVSATSVAQLAELGRPPFPPHAARGEAGFLPATWFLCPGAAAPCLNPVLTGRRTRARWRFTRRSRRAPQCRAPGPRRCCRPRACFGERRGVLVLCGLGLARGTQNHVPARAACACAHVSVRVRALRRPGPKGVGKPGKHTARRRLAEPHGRREGRRSGDCAWQSAPDSSCDVRHSSQLWETRSEAVLVLGLGGKAIPLGTGRGALAGRSKASFPVTLGLTSVWTRAPWRAHPLGSGARRRLHAAGWPVCRRSLGEGTATTPSRA